MSPPEESRVQQAPGPQDSVLSAQSARSLTLSGSSQERAKSASTTSKDSVHRMPHREMVLRRKLSDQNIEKWFKPSRPSGS